MNNKILLILIVIFSSKVAFSQDFIYKKSGEKIKVKILEKGPEEIKYLNYDDLNGSVLTIPRSDVIMIQYQFKSKDKTKTLSNRKQGSSEKQDSLTHSIAITNSKDTNNKIEIIDKGSILTLYDTELFIQGQLDASKNYNGYKGAGTATLITSLISPFVGLIPGILCSNTSPDERTLNYPNLELVKRPEYYYGYLNKSKKIKRKKVWTNWAIGFGVNLLTTITIYGFE